jgi:hypothetical protein
MKKYLLRSVKYLVTLCLLWAALMWIKLTYEQSLISYMDLVKWYFSNWNGQVMAVMVVLLSATYPYFGFVKREVVATIALDKEQIISAMATSGLTICSQTTDKLTFKASGLQRLTLLFEDEVTVEQCGEKVVISGHRRTVIRAVIRLEGYLVNKHRANE